MTRPISLPLFALSLVMVLAGCPSKDKPPLAVTKLDTAPPNLDSIKANIPPAEKDTFVPPKLPVKHNPPAIPKAPPALQSVVEHEQSFSRFCYQEFGQKQDPKLQGGVALVVTVAASGITNVRVADDTWSSKAGQAVNQCLMPKAKEAWKLAPGAVKSGDYVVQLTFRGT